MKKIFLLLVLIAAANNLLLAQTTTIEMEVVQKFMEYSLLPDGLKSIPDSTKAKRKALISPAYLKLKNVEDAKYNPNMFVPTGFKVISSTEPVVQVYIWGLYGSWRHELFFNVQKENEAYYIIPLDESEVSKYDLFDPWVRVIRNSDFDKAITREK